MPATEAFPESPTPLPAGVIERPTPLGSVTLRDQFFPLTHKHGRVALHEALECPAAFTDRLTPSLTPDQFAGAAFLDIETTGLSGGEHAFAFLVGIGTFDNLAFRVRQYFLAQPFNEPAMLAAVANTLDRCTHLVTFNGTSFDLPRLSARFNLASLPDPLSRLAHIDLLVPARRLYSHILDSRRLTEIEARLLKAPRHGDIGGSQAEARYAAYVRRRNLGGLPALFEHNSLDVRFLPAFLGYLGRQSTRAAYDSQQLVALGRWAEEAGDPAQSIDDYRRAIALGNSPDGEAQYRLARLLERQARWQECIPIWMAERDSADLSRRVHALSQLSRLHKRYLKAPAEALSLAIEARDLILHFNQQRRFVLALPALEKRIAHLETMLRKHSSPRAAPRPRPYERLETDLVSSRSVPPLRKRGGG